MVDERIYPRRDQTQDIIRIASGENNGRRSVRANRGGEEKRLDKKHSKSVYSRKAEGTS